jgi:endonuclease/exonuclease/phosphatase (EEP) superfamily protein YafD
MRVGWRVLRVLVFALAGSLVLVTLLPIIHTNQWWIRLWDFPRLQIASLLALTLLVLPLMFERRSWVSTVTILATIGAFTYQVVRVIPYSRLVPALGAETKRCQPGRSISILNANVLMTNRDYSPLIELVRERDPDLVLLLEPDDDWAAAVAPLHARYPYRLSQPLPNTYGLILLSKLPLNGMALRHIMLPDIPSVAGRLTLRGGARIDLYGIHPKPPVPGADTDARDAELVIVGHEIRRSGRAGIVLGDLNDVAWSDTNRLFEDLSGTIDPRIGRGFYPTFHAQYPLLRWPLDHVFYTPHFALVRMERLPDIGSDHFPLLAELCLIADARERLTRKLAPAEVREDAAEAVDEGKREVREE